LFEVIVVNDQSDDATATIIKSFEQLNLINIKQLITSGNGGKKAAVSLGVSTAKGDFILITDADCIVPPAWISEYNRTFNETGALFITGPVMLQPETGFFNKFQCLEFNSLIASTAGYIGINKPVMCNGANMGYSVSAYQELLHAKTGEPGQPDILNSNITSGDDVFLMLSMKKRFGAKSITFLNSGRAIVYTNAQPGIREFIAQRIRWVSKSNGYRDNDVILSAISIYSFNLICFLLIPAALVLLFFLTTSYSVYALALPLLTGLLLIAKTTVDYVLLAAYSNVYGQKQLLKLLPVFEFIVIAYTTMIGALGGFMPFKWKGRLFRK
jgi:poly-beta-1,6-N-acetyl-D-glucosamine synthase